MFRWLTSDGKVIFLSMALRSFGYIAIGIAFPIYLTLIGYDVTIIGLLVTSGFLSGATFTAFSSFFADRIGRKRSLLLFSSLSIISGIILTFSRNIILLFIASVLGSIGTSGAAGAFSPIEHAIITQSCSSEYRTKAFSYYYLFGSIAGSLGSLFGGFPDLMVNYYNMNRLMAFQILFLIFSGLSLIVFIAYLMLSKKCELNLVNRLDKTKIVKISSETKSFVLKLSILFSVDSFAGGFLSQSMVSYWFYARFNIELASISQIFFLSKIFVTISFLIAPYIARKIGLLNTQVFTHLPSSIMLSILPLAPDLNFALALYLGRQLLSEMDVPTRQSYIMAIVKPEERTFASGVTSLVRVFSASISPSIAGYIMKIYSLSAPLGIGGILKTAYDISLYLTFRNIKPPEEIKDKKVSVAE
ncbi:MAG: MFS transporter [archaeon GB-1867-035]|nr:MFS transporter [Candidatus Culexmicrobium profundum]